MLIDSNFFTKGSRQIQNVTLGTGGLPSPAGDAVRAAIDAYIEEHQEMYLTRMLGATLGNRVNAYLVCLDEDEEPRHMESLDTVCGRLREPFADYVFFHILRDINEQVTMTGLVRLKCANEYVAPIRRQVTAWNTMVERHRLFVAWAASSECPVTGISTNSDMLEKINVLNI